MTNPPAPENEAQRLAALVDLGLLDTAAEERFDRITRLLALTLDIPIAMVSLIDTDRQWFKSRVGLDAQQTTREISFCGHAILSDETFIVTDAHTDPRFSDNPLVTGDPYFRFYAGRPLHAPGGERVGTLCVIDSEPRDLSPPERQALEDFAGIVETEMQRVALIDALDRNRQLETLYGAMFAASDQSLMLLAVDGTVVLANDAIDRMLGYAPGAVDSENPFELVHPDDVDDAVNGFLEVVAGTRSKAEPWRLRMRAADGSWRWLETHAHDLTAVAEVGAVLVSARDVTDRVNATEALETSAARLSVALEVAHNGFVEFDEAGQIVAFNDGARIALGLQMLDANAFWNFRESSVDRDGNPFGPEYRPLADAVFEGRHLHDEIIGARMQAGERDVAAADPHQRELDGDIRWLAINTAPLIVGDARHTMLSAFDVTHLRRVERSLRDTNDALIASELRYKTIVETAREGIWMFDDEYRAVFANDQLGRILGYTTDEIVGRFIHDFIPAEYHGEIRKRRQDREAGRSFQGDVIYQHRDGHHIDVRASVAPIMDQAGNYAGAIAMVTDITEQQKVKAERIALSRRIELIFENTNDIVTVVDDDLNALYISPSARHITGFEQALIAGALAERIHPDDLGRVIAGIQPLLRHEKQHTDPVVYRFRDQNDDWIYLESVAVDLSDEPAVNGILVTTRDISERQRLAEATTYRSLHDPLTDLLNRAAFTEQLTRVLARTARTDEEVAVCYLDLDHFKPINDTHGHAAGDAVLIETAERLHHAVRGGDTIARIGGDEFVIICDPIHDPQEALTVAERALAALAAPFELPTGPVHCGASAGIAISEHQDTVEGLLSRADDALYDAKRARRGTVSLAPSTSSTPV